MSPSGGWTPAWTGLDCLTMSSSLRHGAAAARPPAPAEWTVLPLRTRRYRRLVTPDADARLQVTRKVGQGLVGLGEAEAVAMATAVGLRLRVVHLASPTDTWLTADLRTDRITVYVELGKIVRAAAG
jgi:hypothetical protein